MTLPEVLYQGADARKNVKGGAYGQQGIPPTLSGVNASTSPAMTTTPIIRAIFCVIVPVTSRGVGIVAHLQHLTPRSLKKLTKIAPERQQGLDGSRSAHLCEREKTNKRGPFDRDINDAISISSG